MERFRLQRPEGEFDDAVIKNIEEFLPYRNEAIQLFITIAQYSPTDEITRRLHRFFESLIPYMYRPNHISQWSDWDLDNYKFIVHELFLYALAILLKHERFDQANHLLQQQYYVPENSDYGRDVTTEFTVFRTYIKSLEARNQRLKLRRLSLRADLLKERCSSTGVEFRYLMQADFVAFMRAEILKNRWWPETLLYVGHFRNGFGIFARSGSKTYFDKVKSLLAINVPQDLEPLFKTYQDGSRQLPRWEFEGFNPAALLGYEHLCTQP